MKNVTIGYININSIRNKFGELKLLLQDFLDILIIAETKLDPSFPVAQFLIKGYSRPFRLDISCHSGGLLLYKKEGIAARPLHTHFKFDKIQIIPIELHLKTRKWLLLSLYRPEHVDPLIFLEHLTDIIFRYKMLSTSLTIIADFSLSKIIHFYSS